MSACGSGGPLGRPSGVAAMSETCSTPEPGTHREREGGGEGERERGREAREGGRENDF